MHLFILSSFLQYCLWNSFMWSYAVADYVCSLQFSYLWVKISHCFYFTVDGYLIILPLVKLKSSRLQGCRKLHSESGTQHKMFDWTPAQSSLHSTKLSPQPPTLSFSYLVCCAYLSYSLYTEWKSNLPHVQRDANESKFVTILFPWQRNYK